MRRATLLLLLLSGCDSLPPPPPPPATQAAGVRAAAAPARATDPPAAGAPSPAPTAAGGVPTIDPRLVVALEVSGRVTVAPTDGGQPAGRVLVALTDGPCFRPGTHYLALAAPSPGASFTLAAFPPRHSRLEVCGALFANGRRRSRYWARSDRGPLALEGAGPLRFAGLDVMLARMPTEITLADGLRLP